MAQVFKVKVKEGLAENFVAFYEHARRRVGDVFTLNNVDKRRDLFPGEKPLVANNDEAKAAYEMIKDADGKVPHDFSFRWMEPVPASVPEKVSTAQQSMDRRSDTIKAEKAASRQQEPGAAKSDSKDVI
jgi:hypothetical protein